MNTPPAAAPPKLKPGDKLWYVPAGNYQGAPREVTVRSVGRVWFTLDSPSSIRFSVANLVSDGRGYTSPGYCHRSKEEWKQETQDRHCWSAFRRSCSNIGGCPVGIHAADIRRAAAILGIELPEDVT